MRATGHRIWCQAGPYMPKCTKFKGAQTRGGFPATTLQHNATSWDNGCQKPPLLTPFLTPVAPRRARDRVPSILALGLFLPVSDFTQPETVLLRYRANERRSDIPRSLP